jgi:neopullulanase
MKLSHFFLPLIICSTLHLPAQDVQHIAPLHWWVGMKNSNLQLMLHGTNIGTARASLQYPGVRMIKQSSADSKNYLFLDLLITAQALPGTITIVLSHANGQQTKLPYSLLPRQQKATDFKGFSSADVIYLLTPDRFANGDTTNDVVPGMLEQKTDRSFEGARHGGDIRGIINHLDYIQQMGFTAIWPQPMLENDMAAWSYHGYAITNRYKTDARYGTLQDYQELAQKAKARGIKLIVDDVINHIGSNYWWMNDLPFKDWLNQPQEKKRSNHRRTVNQDPYAAEYDKKIFTEGWFDTSMPDLNGRNPFMARYLIQSSIWWVETLQAGGIRQDTYPYSHKEFLSQWSCAIMKEYPNFNIVGEEWSQNPLITSYWQQGIKNADGYSNCLKTVMDFPLQDALVKGLQETDDPNFSKGLVRLYEALANDFVYPNPHNLLVLGDNHDVDRLLTQLANNEALYKMALAYLLTVRGIPQIYYGTEILAHNNGHPGNHGFIRSDFAGGWPGDSVNAFTGAGLSPAQTHMQQWLKQLLNWRKTATAIHEGKTLHFAPFNGIYVFFRYTPKQTIMVVLNKNNSEQQFSTLQFEEIIKGKKTATAVGSQQQFLLSNNIVVAPHTTTIFEIK